MLHSSFYRFVPVADPQAAADAVRTLAQGLQGSVVLAHEGISGTVAGPAQAVEGFEAAVQQMLGAMVFKHSACITEPFGRLKVGVKPEIVALGLDAALPPPDEADASHLSPAEWRDMLARDDAVVLDNRNHFEYRLGHFKNAVDPQVDNFRDFVAYVEQHAPAWRDAGRPVAMYCTGGIRCDKTAPWLRSLGLDVRQLEGGILNYFQSLPDADRDWAGECFVFDKRIALDTRLQQTDTTAADVYDATRPEEAWRLQRALKLDKPDAGDKN